MPCPIRDMRHPCTVPPGFCPYYRRKAENDETQKKPSNLTWIILALQIFCVACKPVEKLPKRRAAQRHRSKALILSE